MAMSTQIVLICLCCFVADSYIFAIDITDGEDHIKIPFHLPNPFNIFHGMFDPPKSHERNHHHQKRPFTSKITTEKQEFKEEMTTRTIGPVFVTTGAPFVTTQAPFSTNENSEEDIFVNVPHNIERQESKGPRVDHDDEIKAVSEEHNETPEVNTLSIHDEPILSVMIPNDYAKMTTEMPKLETIEPIERNSINTKLQNNKTDPTKNTDYLIVPVNAIFTTPANSNLEVNDSSNTLTKMSGMDNGMNYNQGYPNNGFNNVNPNPLSLNPVPNYNNMNPNFNAVPYGYQPTQYGNPSINLPNQVNPGNLPNSYTMMPISNLPGANLQTLPNNNNLYYNNPNVIQPNSPQQLYNLVPINGNYPNGYGVNQPNNFIPNNQPNNFVPYNNNQPISFVPSNQPNNFVPANNNFVPANNNFVPANNNFVPANGNFVPANNNFAPVNNLPNNNNFIPLNNNNPNNIPMNQPYSFIPINNQPNTVDPNNNYNAPLNNNFIPNNNFNNQPNNFVPINNYPNNFVPYQGNNFVPYKDQTNATDVKSQSEPAISLVVLNDKDEAEKSIPQNEESSDKSSDKENNDQND